MAIVSFNNRILPKDLKEYIKYSRHLINTYNYCKTRNSLHNTELLPCYLFLIDGHFGCFISSLL